MLTVWYRRQLLQARIAERAAERKLLEKEEAAALALLPPATPKYAHKKMPTSKDHHKKMLTP